MKRPIVIIGAGGLGREILSLLRALPEWEPIGFLDDNLQKSSKVSALPVLGSIGDAKSLLKTGSAVVIAIGDPRVKAAVAVKLEKTKFYFPTLIHPSAVLMNKDATTIEHGTIISSGVILTTNITIGKHVLVNINATLGHDVKIGNYSSIMPGVNIAGAITLGESVLIGAGANIRNGIKLGDGATVGMGAAVIQNVQRGQTVAGVPAKPIDQ